MSATGDCHDKAVAESFFATLKKELVDDCAFQTRIEAYDAISDYNAKRHHSAAGTHHDRSLHLRASENA